ncbi:MAG: hypothetical protein ABI647_18900 [Gemmatimonadota bacterium]
MPRLAGLSLGRRLVPCYWGGDHGARLEHGGKSIPSYDTARALVDTDPADEAALLWEMLQRDPYFELRLLATATVAAPRMIGEEPPGDELGDRLAAFIPSAALETALVAAGLQADFEPARRAVAAAAPVRDALRSAPAALDDHRQAIARALVSVALAAAEERMSGADAGTSWVLAGPERDELVRLVADALGGSDRSIGGWIGKQLGGVAAWYGTRRMVRKRGAISDAAFPGAGDILLYQARGDEIRRFIRQALTSAEPPVTIIAHSLGGIAAVDLLAAEPVPGVDLLMTVGSQAPFLYEIGALWSLRPDQRLPDRFPRWLNVYDPRDFLSYLARPVFEDDRIRDVMVDNGESFPRSHSAYWSNPAVWTALEHAWASPGPWS